MYDLKRLNENLADVMRAKRKKMGYTQAALARKAEIDLKYLQKLESKKIIIEPKLKTLAKIAEQFDMTLKLLLLKIIE